MYPPGIPAINAMMLTPFKESPHAQRSATQQPRGEEAEATEEAGRSRGTPWCAVGKAQPVRAGQEALTGIEARAPSSGVAFSMKLPAVSGPSVRYRTALPEPAG
jgi:hypothetical protein